MNIARSLAAQSCGVYIGADGIHDLVFRDDRRNARVKMIVGFGITFVASVLDPASLSLVNQFYLPTSLLAAPALLSLGIAQISDGVNARQNGQSGKVAFCTGTIIIAFAVYCFYKGYGNLPVDSLERSPDQKACIDTLNDGFGALPPNVLNGSIGKVYEHSDSCSIKCNNWFHESNVEWHHSYKPLDKMSIGVRSPNYFRIYDEEYNCNSTILGKAIEVCKRVLAQGFGGIPPLNLSLFKKISTSIKPEKNYALCEILLSKEAAKLFNATSSGPRWSHSFNIKLADDCLLDADLYSFRFD